MRKRHLEFKARIHGYGQSSIAESLFQVPWTFYTLVRNEVQSEFADNVKKYAKKNIKEGNKESTAILSHQLENSIMVDWSPDDNTLIISVGDGLPYAEVHNKPRGTFTEIAPKNFGYLQFFLAKQNKWIRTKKPVQRPGTAFFTRAWTKAYGEIPRYVAKWAAYFNASKFQDNIMQLSDTGVLAYRGGSKSRASLENEGMIDKHGRFTPKARRNMRLYGTATI